MEQVDDVDVAVIGAGPHGLAVAAHLLRAKVDCCVLGEPMSFWRTMPEGMLLRSSWTASSIAEYDGPLSLESYCAATDRRLDTPLPLADFLTYGDWVAARLAPNTLQRRVTEVRRDRRMFRVGLEDGDALYARRVVVAAGIAEFVHRPRIASALPGELASHSCEHRGFSEFADKKVLVVGGGQSALESAALLHESGSDVSVAVRANRVNWLHGGKYERMLGRLAPLVYAPTDVGPMGISRIVAAPTLFRRLPRSVQEPMAARAIRPAGALWLQKRLEGVPIHLGRRVRSVSAAGDGVLVDSLGFDTEQFDHVLFGTGYRIDVSRYRFLGADLVQRLDRVKGYPLLGPGLESSVPGLYFTGATAAYSFGPIMRFVAGGWYAARSLASAISSSMASSRSSGLATPTVRTGT